MKHYVIWASDCTPTGILGVAPSFKRAAEHYNSVLTNRRGYRWSSVKRFNVNLDNPFDPICILREALIDYPDRPAVTVRIVRCVS